MVNITTPLLIVGAALPRTGTTSIVHALEKLGYRVWHATTFGKAMWPIWMNITEAEEAGDVERYEAAFDTFVEQLSAEGFNATLDQPSCFVYDKLLEYYPDAQVLNTQRSRSSWARSMVEMSASIDLLLMQPPYSLRETSGKGPFGMWNKEKLGIKPDEIFREGVPNATTEMEARSAISLETFEQAYDRYQAKVKASIPEEQLVQFSVKQGWRPLCDRFLTDGVDCPVDEPFPYVNTREQGFLLDWREKAAIKVQLYKVHPILATDWLAKTIFYVVRHARTISASLAIVFGTAAYLLLR